MPGQDDPFASIAKPLSGGDPFASIAKNDNGTPAATPTDTRNSFQKRVDDAVNTPSATGPRWLDSFGRGAAEAILTPIAHPIESAKGLVHAASPTGSGLAGADPASNLIANSAKGLYDDYKQNGLSHALGNVAGGMAAGEATGGLLGRVAEPVGGLLKSGGSKLDNAILGTTVGDMEHGANPGAGLSNNRIWGFSQNKLLGGVNRKIPEVTAENRNILAQANPNVLINRSDAVAQPFNDAIGSATNPHTGAAMPAQISKTIKTRNSLLNELDPNTGAITTSLRDPYVSPLQAAQLKSNIYGMTDYDNPSRAAFANNALKGSAHNLKDAIETAVPESKPSGENLHNLMSAKDILRPRVEGTRSIPASKEALLQHAYTGAGTGAAALMDAAGAGGSNLARILHAPLLAPGVGAAASLASAPRPKSLLEP